MYTISPNTLRRQLTEVYRAWGMLDKDIAVIIENMVESDLRGIDSHGVGMLPRYDGLRKDGALNMVPDVRVVRDFGAIALVDADHGLGHVAGTKAMLMACDKAEQFGVGAVTARGSNHFGAAGVYSTMAVERGLIGLCTTGTTQRSVLPTFAKEPRSALIPSPLRHQQSGMIRSRLIWRRVLWRLASCRSPAVAARNCRWVGHTILRVTQRPTQS